MSQTVALTRPLGTDWTYLLAVQGFGTGGAPASPAEDGYTLAASISFGAGRAAIVLPSIEWLDLDAWTATLTVTAEQTAALEPGFYRLYVTVDVDGQILPVFDGMIRLTGSPGTADEPGPAYCSMRNVRAVASWIDNLITAEDLGLSTDLAEHRARARTRLEDAIVAAYRPSSRRGSTGGYQLGDPGSGSWGWDTESQSSWMRDQLAAGRLLLTGPRGDRAREITACLAVALLCSEQIGKGKSETDYQALARQYFARADSLMAGYVAELDLDADGSPDLWVRLGVLSLR